MDLTCALTLINAVTETHKQKILTALKTHIQEEVKKSAAVKEATDLLESLQAKQTELENILNAPELQTFWLGAATCTPLAPIRAVLQAQKARIDGLLPIAQESVNRATTAIIPAEAQNAFALAQEFGIPLP